MLFEYEHLIPSLHISHHRKCRLLPPNCKFAALRKRSLARLAHSAPKPAAIAAGAQHCSGQLTPQPKRMSSAGSAFGREPAPAAQMLRFTFLLSQQSTVSGFAQGTRIFTPAGERSNHSLTPQPKRMSSAGSAFGRE